MAPPLDLIRKYQEKHSIIHHKELIVLNHEHFKEAGCPCFRTYYHSVFCFFRGEAIFKVGFNEYTVKAGDIVTVGPGEPYQWNTLDDLGFDAIIFNEDIFKHTSNISFFYSLDYFCPDKYAIIRLKGTDLQEANVLVDAIKLFKNNAAVMPGLLQSFLELLRQLYHMEYNKAKKELSGKEAYVTTFRLLLVKNLTKHKAVAYYAAKMNITSKYLSEVLLSETGWTAKRWIDHHLSVEAKAMLSYTNLSIKQIAYQLGFDDVSHFSKTFKKWSGITPGEFRTQSN